MITKRLSVAALLVALAAAGCAKDQQSQVDRPPSDTSSIAEAPLPKIRPETYVAAGDLAMTRNQPQQAAEQYGRALKITAGDAPVIKKLGLAQVQAGQMSAAEATFRDYLTATNGSADAYGTLGYCQELGGNPTGAEKTYQEGIKKHPAGALCRINYGLMLVRNNKVEVAVAQMSAVLEPHEVNYNVASVYEQLGRRDLAQFYYRRALECKPSFSAAQQKIAMLK